MDFELNPNAKEFIPIDSNPSRNMPPKSKLSGQEFCSRNENPQRSSYLHALKKSDPSQTLSEAETKSSCRGWLELRTLQGNNKELSRKVTKCKEQFPARSKNENENENENESKIVFETAKNALNIRLIPSASAVKKLNCKWMEYARESKGVCNESALYADKYKYDSIAVDDVVNVKSNTKVDASWHSILSPKAPACLNNADNCRMERANKTSCSRNISHRDRSEEHCGLRVSHNEFVEAIVQGNLSKLQSFISALILTQNTTKRFLRECKTSEINIPVRERI